MSGLRRKMPVAVTAGPISIWMLIFILLPMLYILFISFMTRDVYGNIEYTFTLDNYKEMFQPLYLSVIGKSIKMAFITTVICLVVGYPLAYYIASKPSKTAAKLLMLVMIPYWTSSLVRLFSINQLGMPNGFINLILLKLGIISEPINFLFSDGIVIVGLLIAMLPFSVLPLYSSIEKLDKSLLEASKDLGAKPAKTFFKVTVPLTMPGIVGCVLLVFIPSLGMYYVPEMLGGGKVMLIGTLIKNQFLMTKNWPFGASLAILLILITLAMMWIYTRVGKLDDLEVC
ncbi:ABC transporter permease [Zhenpiania hominis]|uniref:ABC transporter permease n=1 Tax=Zhenpiania hominis TaxID=2763644 RepID=UPI0039F4EC96